MKCRHPCKAAVACLFAAAATALFSPAHACLYMPDTSPLQQRLATVQTAFVGVVRWVNEERAVVFDVEVPLRSPPGAAAQFTQFTAPLKGGTLTSCDLGFRIGDRWLYAGRWMNSPSTWLGPATRPLKEAAGLVRDADLGLPAEWQSCTHSTQCVVVPYGCTATAANRQNEERATRRAYERGGDPKAVSCESLSTRAGSPLGPGMGPVAACVASRCGAWLISPK